MSYNGLNEFVTALEANNQLIRIKEYVNPELEITEITDRISKSNTQNKALLFENNGTNFPLLINAYGSEERMCTALNIHDFNEIENEINALINNLTQPITNNQKPKTINHKPKTNSLAFGLKSKIKTLIFLNKISGYFPKIIKHNAPCQEIINKNPVLSSLPILKCWTFDGGKFITLPVVNTKDPVTGIRNAGMYRMQLFSENTTGMHWHLHKTGAKHFNEYLKLKKKIPIAVILGGDPVYAYCASAPLPDGVDEYILAGFLLKKSVKLVKCITQDIEVPIDSDIVIEGYVDPTEPLVNEGPFGDHTGFYSLPAHYPLFHVTCITNRKNAIYPATIVGIPPQEDYWLIKASERIFLPLMQKAGLPEVIDINMPDYGVAHNLVIVQIKNEFIGQAHKVAHSLWGMGQMFLNKILIITTQNPHDEAQIFQSIISYHNINDILFFSTGPLDALEHASNKFAFGGKMAIDLTNESKNNNQLWNNHEIELVVKLLEENNIVSVNFNLLKYRILLIQSSKEKLFSFENFAANIAAHLLFPYCIVLCDKGLTLNNKKIVLWHCLANIDTIRDIKKININKKQIVLFDCTSKPQIKSPWPNPVYSSKQTISKIDKIWNKLGFIEFEESPSKIIYDLIDNEGFIK